jgi:Holliday junction resolvasome RuvABC endonuclease subunit
VIIGIDPAARKLAISGVDFVYQKLPMDDTEACGQAFRALSEVLTYHFTVEETPVIYMESSISRGNPRAGIVQAHGVGALLAAAAEFRIEVRRVDNMTWKKRLIGNARAEKEEIAEYVRRRDPVLHEACAGNQDLMDALCIRWYGEQNYPIHLKARKLRAKVEDKKAEAKAAARRR